MNIKKYKHACFTVEQDSQLLVVDPGNFSDDLNVSDNVVAVVITHKHEDHLDKKRLADIQSINPDVTVIGPRSVIEQIEGSNTKITIPGESMTTGPFTLSFFGGSHATIHAGLPAVDNVGVMINDKLYYPGDSFYVPDRAFDMLALPVAAPWMKVGEAIDYLEAIRTRFAFPTHDAILSEEGKAMVDYMLSKTASDNNIEYRRIDSAPLSI